MYLLLQGISKCRDEELEHRDIGLRHNAELVWCRIIERTFVRECLWRNVHKGRPSGPLFWDLSNHWTGIWTAAVEWNDHMEFYLQQKAPFYLQECSRLTSSFFVSFHSVRSQKVSYIQNIKNYVCWLCMWPLTHKPSRRMQDSIAHSIFHSTVPVHFPVQQLETSIIILAIPSTSRHLHMKDCLRWSRLGAEQPSGCQNESRSSHDDC